MSFEIYRLERILSRHTFGILPTQKIRLAIKYIIWIIQNRCMPPVGRLLLHCLNSICFVDSCSACDNNQQDYCSGGSALRRN